MQSLKSKKKGIVRIKGPLGTFTLQKDSDRPIVLLATGTGYAPIHSILLDLIHQNSERQVHFYWGARQQEDLYALEEAEALIGRLKNAKFLPVLSKPDSEWKGESGYVQNVAAQNYPDLSQYEVLCLRVTSHDGECAKFADSKLRFTGRCLLL